MKRLFFLTIMIFTFSQELSAQSFFDIITERAQSFLNAITDRSATNQSENITNDGILILDDIRHWKGPGYQNAQKKNERFEITQPMYIIHISGSGSGDFTIARTDNVRFSETFSGNRSAKDFLLQPGKYTVLPNRPKGRSGIDSWDVNLTLKLSPAKETTSNVITNINNLTGYRNRVGQVFEVRVTGSTRGQVWGGSNGIYTDDSSLGAAAVHAGLLKPNEVGVLKVEILSGRNSYTGSTRNGVTSSNWDRWDGSFRFR